jgi:hypothetical protein
MLRRIAVSCTVARRVRVECREIPSAFPMMHSPYSISNTVLFMDVNRCEW